MCAVSAVILSVFSMPPEVPKVRCPALQVGMGADSRIQHGHCHAPAIHSFGDFSRHHFSHTLHNPKSPGIYFYLLYVGAPESVRLIDIRLLSEIPESPVRLPQTALAFIPVRAWFFHIFSILKSVPDSFGNFLD